MKKYGSVIALLLSIVLMLSSCNVIKSNTVQDSSSEVAKAAEITTTLSEATSLPETTTASSSVATTAAPAATQVTTVTTLPETVKITTTVPPAPPAQVTTTEQVVAKMTAPPVTTPIVTAAPLVTTVAPVTAPAPAIQPKLTAIDSTYTHNNLTADQKIVYNKILAAAKARQTLITFDNNPSVETVTQVYSTIYSEEINLQYLADSFKYEGNPVKRMQISFDYPAEVTNSMNAQTEAKANEIISKITPTMTAFDIVKYFHDTIVRSCTYDLNEEFQSTAYGALVKGRATCQGYSHAMALLCNKVGIENAFATGFATEAHMWNMIKLDGNWYNMDVTWDDPDNIETPDLIMYDYFNVTNAELGTRQIYPGLVPLPVATVNQDNYFTHNGLVANSVSEAEQILYNQYINAANNHSRYVNIKFANKQIYDQAYSSLITNQGIFTIQAMANSKATNKFNPESMSLMQNTDVCTFEIIISY